MIGLKQRDPFGTKSGGIGGVLLIAARHDCAVCQQERRTDLKMGLGSIRLRRRPAGSLCQRLLLARKFGRSAYLNGCLNM